MNWKFASAAVLSLIISLGVAFFAAEKYAQKTVPAADTDLRAIQLAGKTVKVEVVGTPEEKARGLGGRDGLPPNEGMLFVFDSDARYRFWMKDMLFSIDILWLSDDGRVVDMRENVSPETYPAVFTPNAPARYVLELPAGFAKSNNVKIGYMAGL